MVLSSLITPLTIRNPGGEEERVKTTVDGQDSRWTYGRALRSGVYQAQFGAPLNATQLYAVNVNTRESSLERFDAELLPNQFRQEVELDAEAEPQLPRPRRAHWFQFLLVGLLVLLFCESFLAWLFGRAQRRTT